MGLSGFSRFENKFPTKCRICGENLPAGTPVYGKKDIEGKWNIICPKCAEGAHAEKIETIEDIVFSADFENLEKMEKAGVFGKNGTFRKPFLEEARENAMWATV